MRAMVDSMQAYPSTVLVVLSRVTEPNFSTGSFIFCRMDVDAGTYTIKIQWESWTGIAAHVSDRTMIVIALPA